MKIILKQFYNPIIFAFFTILNFGILKAQTHNKAAANCIYHDDYLKTASKIKNAVSCVDCYCKICGDKKAKEKEAKKKAEEAAAKQKNAQVIEKEKSNQKEIAKNKTQTGKSKDNEAVLVAPKSKVPAANTTSLKLSAQDQEILDLSKEKKVYITDMRDYNGDGYLMFFNGKDMEKIPGAEPVGRIFYEEDKQKIVLKDLKLRDNAAIGYNYGNKLDENGNFCLTFIWNTPGSNVRGKTFADIVNLQGESLLNDKTIEKVTYKGNGIYELQKAGQDQPTEQYDFKTKKITTLK